MKQKKTFSFVIALLAVMLAILPFLVAFNEVLTKVVENFRLYMWLQERIVPLEIKMVAVLISPFPVDFVAHSQGMTVNGIYAEMTWNCLGWQSLLLYLATLLVGLKGNYTLFSKIETIIIGLLGTFFVNLFRMTFTVLLLTYSRPLYALVYHDYLAAIVTIIWLIFFWWFSYSFTLEQKGKKSASGNLGEVNKV